MAFEIAGGRHPKFPTHQPITKSMYFLPRESVTMLPLVAATCSSAGSSLASGSRRGPGMSDPFRAQLWRRRHFGRSRSSSLADAHAHHPPAILELFTRIRDCAKFRQFVTVQLDA